MIECGNQVVLYLSGPSWDPSSTRVVLYTFVISIFFFKMFCLKSKRHSEWRLRIFGLGVEVGLRMKSKFLARRYIFSLFFKILKIFQRFPLINRVAHTHIAYLAGYLFILVPGDAMAACRLRWRHMLWKIQYGWSPKEKCKTKATKIFRRAHHRSKNLNRIQGTELVMILKLLKSIRKANGLKFTMSVKNLTSAGYTTAKLGNIFPS